MMPSLTWCRRLAGTALVALLSTGCGVSQSLTAPSTLVGNLLVTGVKVEVVSASKVRAIVTGQVADGCTTVGQITQQRTGSTLTITIPTTRDAGAACTQAVQKVEVTIDLEGSFTTGTYTIRVNGVEVTATL